VAGFSFNEESILTKNRWAVTGAIIVAALAAAYPASAWYLGKQIEAAHAELDKQVAAVPYLKLVKHDYERTLFGATEVITLELPAELFHKPPAPVVPEALAADANTPTEANAEQAPVAAPAPAPVAPAAPLPPIQITVKSEIQHGPFPGLRDFGAGSARTVIVFDDATQQKVAAAFGGKPPVEVQTLYSLFGGGHATLTSPAFKFSFAGNPEGSKAAISGDGLTASMDFTAGLDHYTANGDAPRFEIVDDKGLKIVFTGLKFDSTQQRLFKDEPLLYSGTQRFTLAEVLAESTQEGGSKTQIKGLDYNVSIPVAGEHIDMIAKIGATDFQVAEQNFGPIHYDFSLKHVHARKFAALHRSGMALYSKPMAADNTQQLEQAFAALKTPALELMMENPEFTIDRLSMHTTGGDANLSARIKLSGVTAEDFNNPMTLVSKIDFAADLSAPVSLIDTLQPGKATSEEEIQARKLASEQAIAGVVQQGYVTNEGSMLKTRITFSKGQLLVNEKPFNPMGMMQASAAQ
jgi:uncharacterized protein YdgA (DUF945 family)